MKIKTFLILIFPGMLLSCGVKGKPSPPDKPIFIGRPQHEDPPPPNLPEAANPQAIEEFVKQKEAEKKNAPAAKKPAKAPAPKTGK